MTRPFIPAHGGYRNLLSYQKALIVFQATTYFRGRFLNPEIAPATRWSRPRDQANRTSSRAVARASQEELLEDYRDFLRERGLDEWLRNHPHRDRMTRARLHHRDKRASSIKTG